MLGPLQISSLEAVVQGGRGNVRLCFKAASSAPKHKRSRNNLVAASTLLEAPSASREQGLKLSQDLCRDTAILQVRPASLFSTSVAP